MSPPPSNEPGRTPPIPLTLGRALKLQQAKTRAELRDTLIGFWADEMTTQIENYLRQEATDE